MDLESQFNKLDFRISSHLNQVVPRQWQTFFEQCKQDLKYFFENQNNLEESESTMVPKVDSSHAFHLRFKSREYYTGQIKNGMRHGTGTCFFSPGCVYRGEWRNDQCHGSGTLLCLGGEILDCRFDRGALAGSQAHSASGGRGNSSVGRIKILFTNGHYYEGHFMRHKCHGHGFCVYPSGDKYEGPWHEGHRNGRATVSFAADKGKYFAKFTGDFHADEIDGSRDGVYEEFQSKVFKVLEFKKKNITLSGAFTRGRLQSSAKVSFSNGDKFSGNYVDGKPTGLGIVDYNYSIPDNPMSRNPNFQNAKFIGTFKAGRRDGKGIMYWDDGSTF